MKSVSYTSMATATQASSQKRGHAEVVDLTSDNDENQPAPKKVKRPESGPAPVTTPAATKRAHAEAFDPLFDEPENQSAPKQARMPLAPRADNTPAVGVYNDKNDDLDSLFNDGEEEDENNDNGSLFNDNEEGDDNGFLSPEELEAALAEVNQELAAKKAAEAAHEAAEVAKRQAKAKAKNDRKAARDATAREAAAQAIQAEEDKAIKEDKDAFWHGVWGQVMKKRNQASPSRSKASVPKVTSSSPVIDLTDDEPAASTSSGNKSPAFSRSLRDVINLSEDDSTASADASQPESPLRHDTEAAKLRVPSPDECLSLCPGSLGLQYNSNGFPLQQAKMVCRRTNKQERAVNPKLKSRAKELDLASNPNLNRELFNQTIANVSVSINGQTGVQDAVVPLVDSLHSDALQRIRYVDGSLHLLTDFKLLASRCHVRGIELAIEELRVRPTWLFVDPDWHRATYCKEGPIYCHATHAKTCGKIRGPADVTLPEPEVCDLDVQHLLTALTGRTVPSNAKGTEVLPLGVKTLSECFVWTKALSIDLSFKVDDFQHSKPYIKEARDNLQAVNDKHRLVFRKRIESQDCELVVRFATKEELGDPSLSYQEVDDEVLTWLEALPASTEASKEDREHMGSSMVSDNTESTEDVSGRATTPPTEDKAHGQVDGAPSSQEEKEQKDRDPAEQAALSAPYLAQLQAEEALNKAAEQDNDADGDEADEGDEDSEEKDDESDGQMEEDTGLNMDAAFAAGEAELEDSDGEEDEEDIEDNDARYLEAAMNAEDSEEESEEE